MFYWVRRLLPPKIMVSKLRVLCSSMEIPRLVTFPYWTEDVLLLKAESQISKRRHWYREKYSSLFHWFTNSKWMKTSCFSRSGFNPSTFSNNSGSASKKWGFVPYIGAFVHGIKSSVPFFGQSSGGSLQKHCSSGWFWKNTKPMNVMTELSIKISSFSLLSLPNQVNKMTWAFQHISTFLKKNCSLKFTQWKFRFKYEILFDIMSGHRSTNICLERP